jgi:DNA-binding LacI/PurR family transcriptional regulator
VTASRNNVKNPHRPPLKYEELSATLREKIQTLSSGSRLPSLRALMKRYNLSLQTVNAALKKLEEEQLIVTRRGSGIYVSEHRAAKLIILHRSRHPSYHEDAKESSIRKAVLAAGWHLAIRRHEVLAEEGAVPLTPEPKACAHIVSQDLANLKLDLLHQLARQNVPVVILGREIDTHRIDYITGHEQQILGLLIKHLRSLGHRRLALLANEPSGYSEVRRRIELFGELTEMVDLPPGIVIDCRTQPGQKSSHAAHQGLLRYLDGCNGRPLPFTALIVLSSAGGFGALRAFHEKKIRIPDQCSVASFGAEEENALSIPALTDAGTPLPLWGEWAVKLLRRRFEGDAAPSLGFKLPVELTPRESSAAAPVPEGVLQ